jgi:hypothetical protein
MTRPFRAAWKAALLAALLLWGAALSAQSIGDVLLITPEEFQQLYAPKIDSRKEAEGYLQRFRDQRRLLGAGASFTAPLQQYLADTDIGPLEVNPLHASFALFAEAYRDGEHSAELILTAGTVQLTPATDQETQPSVGVPARLDVTLAGRIQAGDYRLFAAWQHVEDSPVEEGLFRVYDRSRELSYRLDPLQDRIILSAQLPRFRSGLLIHRRLEHLSVGWQFSADFLQRLELDANLDRLGDQGWQIGPSAGAEHRGFRLSGGLFYLTAEEVPAAGYLAASWQGKAEVLQLACFYLRPEIGGGYHPGAGGLYLRYKLAGGFDLFPGDEEAPVGFYFNLALSCNNPEHLLLMPIYNRPILSLQFGFSFL